MRCLLCKSLVENFQYWEEKEYLQCTNCSSVMLNPRHYLSSKKEKQRYKEHDNDIYDKRYQAFVSPIVGAVLKDYQKTHKGLDFGSGTGPVITKLLRDHNYKIDTYDPFFDNNKERLKGTYDYIVCCEVVEHFHHPRLEFNRLKEMLKPGGSLYIMTSIYHEDIDFKAWYYKNDSTHVFFYHRKALEYIKRQYNFSKITIRENMITYKL